MSALSTLGAAVGTIIAMRLLLRAFPRFYFSVQDIVTVRWREMSVAGFFLRFGLLFLLSLAFCFLYSGDISAVLEYSISVCLLLIWPYILEHVIYRDSLAHRKLGSRPEPLPQVRRYLVVYLMYSVMCFLASLSAIPVYRIATGTTGSIYQRLLGRFLELDPFLQSLVSDAIIFVALGSAAAVLRGLYRRFLKKHFE